jgi:AraC-like DNA-binding protein/Tfp pilus assembly protein PilF
LTGAQTVLQDSLLSILGEHAKHDTSKVNLLTRIAQIAWSNNPELTRKYAEQALTLSKSLGYPKGIADAYRETSRYYWSQTDYHKAIDYALLGVKAFEQMDDQEGVAWCYGTIGISYAQANNYDRSEAYQLKALKLNRFINNQQGIARNLNNLGYVAELRKDYHKALSYYMQALDLRKQMGVRAEIVMPVSNVGSAYLALNNYDLASVFFRQALEMAEEVDNKNIMALSFQNLGEVKYKTGKYDEAKPYLEKALKIATEIGDKKRKECVYEVFRDIARAQKNFEMAFNYQELLHNLRDTLYSQERTMQLAELEARFDKERKEQAMLLLAQDKQIHMLWNNILLVGLLITFGVFAFLYWLQRYHQKKNQELLNLQIDLLMAHQKELTDKYKDAILTIEESPEESQDQRFVRKAIEVVESNITDTQFGVEKMADALGMSRGSLHRKLKSICGFSPSDFIRNVRLKRAAHLLRHQADSVSQVGFIVGFEDQSYFSKCFKKHFGVTPSEFARSVG